MFVYKTYTFDLYLHY